MSNRPYYVTLTGSKNNAGDFLIRYRAHNLLKALRPDREIVDYNAWEKLDEEKLAVINKAQALVLLGGPALRQNMYPEVYPLTDDLSKIKVPITIMGAGWKKEPGYWSDPHDYNFTIKTFELLKKIEQSGSIISLRDYRSLNALFLAGIDCGIMTGCPALYDLDYIEKPFNIKSKTEVKNIVFSQGVTFTKSKSVSEYTRKLILDLKNMFPNTNLTVAFHHTLDKEKYKQKYNKKNNFVEKHHALTDWLEENDINYKDISGGVDSLIELYNNADLHIGQRVHAHIFMCSTSKPSVLITEDGRGRGLKEVLNGLVFDAYHGQKKLTIPEKVIDRLKTEKEDRYLVNKKILEDVKNNLLYDLKNDNIRMKETRFQIDLHYSMMKKYIAQLP